MPTTVLVALGSNIEPRPNLARAVTRLSDELALEAVSSAWESEPYGAPGTPRFLNAAARLVTGLEPMELKRRLRRIEAALGRRRSGNRNAPRTIDLDVALYGELVVDDRQSGLRIPDPDIHRRAYLALPLAEVAPELVHPVTGERLDEIARRLAGAADGPRRLAWDLASVARLGG